MLDMKLIRENPDAVKKNVKKRNVPGFSKMVDDLMKLDKKWRKHVEEANELRSSRNKISMEIAQAKKEKKSVKTILTKAAKIPKKIEKTEEEKSKLEENMKTIAMRLPNILHESVPSGKTEKDNKVLRTYGSRPGFGFEPKDHFEILKGLGMIESGADAAGHAFFYLKGHSVLLDFALQRFAMDHLHKKGFTVVEPPLMLNMESMMGALDMDDFRDQIYKIEGEDLFLIGTSEHPIAAMMKGRTFTTDELPSAIAGVSPCFRKEVGSHGKYTKGLFRMHQFNKVEQFVFCRPEDSWEWFDTLQKNTESIYDQLGLHYRVVELCAGDIGLKAAKTLDVECWMADGEFREVASNSNVTDYQARRLGIKYKEKAGQKAVGFVHTLNSTAIATSRIMVALVEQNQQEDGSVKVPKALVPYMNGIDVLKKG